MPHILSHEYRIEISLSKFCLLSGGYPIDSMQTVFETRRTRLRMLIDKHGSIADLK